MADLFEMIEDGMTFEQICEHFGADSEETADMLGCRCPYGALGFLEENARIANMTSEESDEHLAAQP